MARSIYADAHKAVVAALIDARRSKKLRQEDLASRVERDQSYISNIERGQRRVDLVEFFELSNAIGVDPVALFSKIAADIERNSDAAQTRE